jgi:hypothetical protein
LWDVSMVLLTEWRCKDEWKYRVYFKKRKFLSSYLSSWLGNDIFYTYISIIQFTWKDIVWDTSGEYTRGKCALQAIWDRMMKVVFLLNTWILYTYLEYVEFILIWKHQEQLRKILTCAGIRTWVHGII